MTNQIHSYKELLEERERLTALLHAQRAELREDFNKLKEEFEPVKAAVAVIGKFTTKDKSNWLLTTAADTAIDLVVRKFILWPDRPFFVFVDQEAAVVFWIRCPL